MENILNLTPDAVKAIQALQHPCGTYQFYRSHLDRLFNYVLNNSDEIGMSGSEAMLTLRALDLLRTDLAAIAGKLDADGEATFGADVITLALDLASPAPEDPAAGEIENTQSPGETSPQPQTSN